MRITFVGTGKNLKQWYIIKTKPHKESHVDQLLSRAQFVTFYPKIRELVHRGMGQYFHLKSFFPSYLFLNVDFSESKNFHLIRYTRGVSQVLCSQNKPVPVPEEVMAVLQGRTDGDGVVRVQQEFKAGDRVRVRKGMVKDLEGILVKPSSEEDRVIVLLRLMNYKMHATLHWSEIEKVS